MYTCLFVWWCEDQPNCSSSSSVLLENVMSGLIHIDINTELRVRCRSSRRLRAGAEYKVYNLGWISRGCPSCAVYRMLWSGEAWKRSPFYSGYCQSEPRPTICSPANYHALKKNLRSRIVDVSIVRQNFVSFRKMLELPMYNCRAGQHISWTLGVIIGAWLLGLYCAVLPLWRLGHARSW